MKAQQENIWGFEFVEYGDIAEAARRMSRPRSTVYQIVNGTIRKGAEETKAALLQINHERQQRIKALSKVTA